ncbi:DUF5999 family protein [Kitasatospora sp. MBT66]|uniref:DUF5999 family protein n=1 Tax=Kitasatospora sp. MBT66 TaxID=1444769 RepID=UPI0005B940E9|nr:DUF5999 family protein [Kitasatospora sp. MBT66]
MSCDHRPNCHKAGAGDAQAAVPVANHPDRGWTLLCNRVVCSSDTGLLLPDGRTVAPRRPGTATRGRAA